MSRGIFNRNPGNIRQSSIKYLGEVQPSTDKAFKQFETMAYGYRAIFVLLDSYRRKGFNNIRKMINRYAPPTENKTDSYVRFVAQKSRIFEDVEIDTNDPAEMIPIVSAISHNENGVAANPDDVRQGWELFIKYRP